jgi:RNA polymerase primary sigma factor
MSDIRKYINLIESADSEFKIQIDDGDEEDDRNAVQKHLSKPDPSSDPEEEAANKQLVQKMSSALGTLPPKYERILRMRYGINTPESSIYDIGTELGIKPNDVLRLERKALQMLRHPSRSRAIRGFMNN